MGCWCGTTYKGVWPSAFPVTSQSPLCPLMLVPAAPSPGGLRCALLCRLCQSISDEEREIIAQVSRCLQLQMQRDGCWWGCCPAPLGTECHVVGASRHKQIPAQPHFQGAHRAVIATWEKGAGSCRVALRLQIMSVCAWSRGFGAKQCGTGLWMGP